MNFEYDPTPNIVTVFILNELGELPWKQRDDGVMWWWERTKIFIVLRLSKKTVNLPNNDRYKVLEINYLRESRVRRHILVLKYVAFTYSRILKLHESPSSDKSSIEVEWQEIDCFVETKTQNGVSFSPARICVLSVVSCRMINFCVAYPLSCEEICSFRLSSPPHPATSPELQASSENLCCGTFYRWKFKQWK